MTDERPHQGLTRRELESAYSDALAEVVEWKRRYGATLEGRIEALWGELHSELVDLDRRVDYLQWGRED